LLDPDTTVYTRIQEVLKDNNVSWMPVLAQPFDNQGELCHPNVGFNNYQFGVDMADYVIDYAKKNWPDAKPEEMGMMYVGFSVVPQLVERETGAKDTWNKAYPALAKNYYFCDGVTGKLDADTSYNLASTTMAANPSIKYWLICAFFDDYADGAARAAEAAGKQDKTIISTCGGSALISHWDNGDDSCWKSAIYTDQRVYAEPIFCGLYALMSGQATPETLWPEWINQSKGEKYASLMLPTFMLLKDNYQAYLMFVDKYTGMKKYSYDVAPGDYTTKVEVPASYKA
jgi:hypothetical protein